MRQDLHCTKSTAESTQTSASQLRGLTPGSAAVCISLTDSSTPSRLRKPTTTRETPTRYDCAQNLSSLAWKKARSRSERGVALVLSSTHSGGMLGSVGLEPQTFGC